MTPEEHILADSGIRPTSIRTLVLKEIMKHGHAFTLADMEQRLPTLDRSTLFRTLTLLVKRQLLHEATGSSGSRLYCLCGCHHKHRHTPHLHFTCTTCHATYCIRDIDISMLPTPEGYEVEEVSLAMKGTCPKCRTS